MSKDLLRLLADEVPDLEVELDKNIHVYIHINQENKEVFYVGIGTDKRPYVKYDRSEEWKKYTESILFNYDVEILFDNLDYGQASLKEKELISKYGRKDKGLGTLLNKTDGGGWTEKYARLNKIYKLKKAKEQLNKIILLNNIENDIKTKALDCEDLNEFKNKFYTDFLIANKLDFTNNLSFKESKKNKQKIYHKKTLQKLDNFLSEIETIIT